MVNIWRNAGRVGVVLIAVLVVLSGAVAAQSIERAGGLVQVAEGEVVDGDLSASGGAVVIAGTVNGDLEAAAGSVLITGTVTGNVEAVAGSVVIEGTVGGDVSAAGGSVVVREGASVGGALEAAAGGVLLAGAVGGDARLAGDEVEVAPTASVGGDVEYDAETFTIAPGAAVAGTVTQNDDLGIDVSPSFGFPSDVGVPTDFSLPTGFFAAWGLVVNLALGALLLIVSPRVSRRVTELGTGESLVSGGVGVLTLVLAPIALLVLLLTVIGIPLALVGGFVFALVLWIAAVYGALVLGSWILGFLDRESRWEALVLGLVVVTLLSFIPILGGVVQFVLLLVGLGAFVLALRGLSRGEDELPVEGGEGQPMAD